MRTRTAPSDVHGARAAGLYHGSLVLKQSIIRRTHAFVHVHYTSNAVLSALDNNFERADAMSIPW